MVFLCREKGIKWDGPINNGWHYKKSQKGGGEVEPWLSAKKHLAKVRKTAWSNEEIDSIQN